MNLPESVAGLSLLVSGLTVEPIAESIIHVIADALRLLTIVMPRSYAYGESQ